jgi:hypothetical protein
MISMAPYTGGPAKQSSTEITVVLVFGGEAFQIQIQPGTYCVVLRVGLQETDDVSLKLATDASAFIFSIYHPIRRCVIYSLDEELNKTRKNKE